MKEGNSRKQAWKIVMAGKEGGRKKRSRKSKAFGINLVPGF